MGSNYLTCRMREADIHEAVAIWAEQYQRYCSNAEAFPGNWAKNTGEIAAFLHKKVRDGIAVAAKTDSKLLGYMTYDEFPFNGEKSVFCPAIAHAAVDEYKEETYLSLYKYIAQEWVERNIFNHMWTIFYNDARLKGILFDLGFGSYLVDAFARTHNRIITDSAYKVRKAELPDAESLYNLVEESREYYRSAPLFLRRDHYSRNDIQNLIQQSNVFMAWDANNAIGFIHVRAAQKDNIIDLSVNNSGLIDEIGVYIKPEYRGRGLGKELLSCVFDYCQNNGIDGIHADFETANLFANKFWRKHCRPMLLSVRRTINKNINDGASVG